MLNKVSALFQQAEKSRLTMIVLAAFLTPVGGAFVRGDNLREAARMGVGMAITAFVAFIQPPRKEEKDNADK